MLPHNCEPERDSYRSEGLYELPPAASHCATANSTCYQRAGGVSGDGYVSWHILKKKRMYEDWNFNFGNTPLDWIQELLE